MFERLRDGRLDLTRSYCAYCGVLLEDSMDVQGQFALLPHADDCEWAMRHT